MNNGVFSYGRKRRIGSKVFHVKDDVFKQCKETGVTEQDIIAEYNKYRKVGIETTWGVAAQSAVREKRLRSMRGGLRI